MDGSKLLERLAKTSLGQQLLAEEATEILEHRRELAGELGRLATEYEVALPPLHQTVEKAAAKLERVQAALRAAQDAHAQAVAARAHATNSHDMRRSQLEGELCTSAPPIIRTFRGQMQDLHDALRRSQFQDVDAKRNAFGEPISRSGPSSYERLAERLERVRAAMRECESLMLLALDEEELSQRLEALRASTDGG